MTVRCLHITHCLITMALTTMIRNLCHSYYGSLWFVYCSSYYKKTCTDELDQLDRNIDKAWHSLQSVIELDEKLTQLESRYAVPEIETEACGPIKAEGEELRRVSRQSLDNRPTKLELETMPIQSLQDL